MMTWFCFVPFSFLLSASLNDLKYRLQAPLMKIEKKKWQRLFDFKKTYIVFTPNPNMSIISPHGLKQFLCAHAGYIILLDRFLSQFKTQWSLKCDQNSFHGFDNASTKQEIIRERMWCAEINLMFWMSITFFKNRIIVLCYNFGLNLISLCNKSSDLGLLPQFRLISIQITYF